MLEKTFAATNFTTKSVHEWTKWSSAIGWLSCFVLINIHDAHLR